VLESRLTYTRDNQPGEANSADPEAVIQQGGATALSIGRNNFSPRYTNAKTTQWAESLALVRGSHNYKMGFDLNFQRIGNFFPGNFSGSYTFTSYANFANKIPFSFTQAFAGAGTAGPLSEPNVGEYAFYAQDSWRVNGSLTLNYGIRYDFFNYAQPSVKNPDAGPRVAGTRHQPINLDHNNLAGRFGLRLQAGRERARGTSRRLRYVLRAHPVDSHGHGDYSEWDTGSNLHLTSGLPTYPSILSAPPTLNRTPDIYVFAKEYVQPLRPISGLQSRLSGLEGITR
jgi:outer membrane receptor protein involved in Fe transport